MRTGDKVRFLHSTGEGIVRKFIDQKNVEVEIEDGFIIPVLKSELVLIHNHKSDVAASPEQSLEDNTDQGLWITLVPFNDKSSSLHILNNSNSEILFTLGEESKEKYSGISSGILKSGASVKITDVSMEDFDKWPEYVFQALFFKQGLSILKEPILKRIKFKAANFFKSKRVVPILNKEAYAFSLDAELIHTDPKKIVEEMFSKGSDPINKKIISTKPSKEIDLHIENLIDDFSKMSNIEIIEIQMKTFEKNLDNAIALGMEEIIFIHGVGNGVLKQNIHKRLSKNKNIQFFQDAKKEKFGYGATLVKIK